MESITIRYLGPKDAEEYVRLRLQALQESPESFLATYEETIADENLIQTYEHRLKDGPDHFTLGAFDGGLLVSVATLVRQNRAKIRHKAEIFAVYTAPCNRRKGISRRILKELIANAREMPGLEKIMLTAVTEN
ncbi:GNAT family N-acetyltransferase [Peribacillus sp. SCS-155]|uniref:GNAT family N-acetyltransferase n=1 Tax=Peribacillus sedimenti TaxID=3115297 RepID=UPI0039062389